MPDESRAPTDPVAVSAMYVTHGGGPLPLLGDPGHRQLTEFLSQVTADIVRPAAILVVSAHWEEPVASITAAAEPPLIYDYGGFPEAAYHIRYPAPGAPALAHDIHDLLRSAQIDARLDVERGFDHGMFVPLKLMYPDASIPCVQLSLLRGLDPAQHLALGAALAPLRERNVLLLGSGSSFHNMRAFFQPPSAATQAQNFAFEDWLGETCCSAALDEAQRRDRLIHWDTAPGARFSHPREEHLLPLHVCVGSAARPAFRSARMQMLNTRTSAYLWT